MVKPEAPIYTVRVYVESSKSAHAFQKKKRKKKKKKTRLVCGLPGVNFLFVRPW